MSPEERAGTLVVLGQDIVGGRTLYSVLFMTNPRVYVYGSFEYKDAEIILNRIVSILSTAIAQAEVDAREPLEERLKSLEAENRDLRQRLEQQG